MLIEMPNFNNYNVFPMLMSQSVILLSSPDFVKCIIVVKFLMRTGNQPSHVS